MRQLDSLAKIQVCVVARKWKPAGQERLVKTPRLQEKYLAQPDGSSANPLPPLGISTSQG